MAKEKFREEVLNVVLAQLLNEHGIVSAPELSISSPGAGHKMPDVVVAFEGLRTVLEGKVDKAGAHDEVQAQAVERVEDGIAHLALGVVYPPSLTKLPFKELRDGLAEAELRVEVVTEAGPQGWTTSTVEQLGDLLRRTFDELVAEDVVLRAVAALELGVAHFAQAISATPAVVDRSADILGIGEPDEDEDA
jgi:hypothetical protein